MGFSFQIDAISSLSPGFLSQKTRKSLCAVAPLRETFWLRPSALAIVFAHREKDLFANPEPAKGKAPHLERRGGWRVEFSQLFYNGKNRSCISPQQVKNSYTKGG
jgi:hypothetical protein